MERKSQSKRLLEILNDGDWHCTNEFYAAYFSDPRTLICRLKKQGFNFKWRYCCEHNHIGNSKQWQLLYAAITSPSETKPDREYTTKKYTNAGFTCDCPGFRAWKQCKHVQFLKEKFGDESRLYQTSKVGN